MGQIQKVQEVILLGVDASGAVESCTDATTEINSAISTHASIANAHHNPVTITDSSEIDFTLNSRCHSVYCGRFNR